MFVCVFGSVCESKHFRLWSPNGWSDRDGRIFIRCAGAAVRRWCRLRTGRRRQLRTRQVPTAIFQKVAKNHLRTAAGQTNGRIRLKLGEPIATMRGLVLLGVATVMPHSHV